MSRCVCISTSLPKACASGHPNWFHLLCFDVHHREVQEHTGQTGRCPPGLLTALHLLTALQPSEADQSQQEEKALKSIHCTHWGGFDALALQTCFPRASLLGKTDTASHVGKKFRVHLCKRERLHTST